MQGDLAHTGDMYESLRRAALTAIVLTAAIWALFVVLSQELVEVPALAQTVPLSITSRPASRPPGVPAATRTPRSRRHGPGGRARRGRSQRPSSPRRGRRPSR